MGWNAQEQYFEIATEAGPTSRIYARGLKPSEDAARYSKFAGVTLAGIYVDQPEEMPEDFFAALQARLSQPGYPHQMLLTPNPPAEDHWLARASTMTPVLVDGFEAGYVWTPRVRRARPTRTRVAP